MDKVEWIVQARLYVVLGWPVLPLHTITDDGQCSCGSSNCRTPGKHPRTKGGLKDATTDKNALASWYRDWPKANIGIVTGKVSGVFVLDIDPKNGGFDSLDAIEAEHGKVPDDVLQITGSGGRHYLFKYAGPMCRNTTNLWPGIDTRGDGGYIVVAPSNHISGKVYFWDSEDDQLTAAILPEVPRWLLDKLATKGMAKQTKQDTDKRLGDDDVKRIRAALRYVSDVDDRDTWRTVGMALHSTGAGNQAYALWCEWSEQSEKFDTKDQRRVWGSFKPGGGIQLATLFGMAKEHGYVPPEPKRPPEPPLSVYEQEASKQSAKDTGKRKTKRKPNSPRIDQAAVSDQLQRYVFLKSNNKIFDTVTRLELSREGFDGAFMHVLPDAKPSAVFLKNPASIKVDGLIYLPGINENPIRRGGAVFWNIWRDPGVVLPDEATREDVEPWLEHLHYLYPDQAEQAHLLNWMASTLQRPHDKINHALLIAGTSRVGKDMLLNPLRYGLGQDNISEPPAGELKETYTDYLHHSKLVIFQEIQLFEGLNLENKLKPMLAAPPDMLRVRLFKRGFYETPNIVQAIFMSNYRDALHISEGDGRYFAVWTDAEPMPKEYYTELVRWMENGGNGLVVRWLLDRNLSDFNSKQPAPLTQFKSELMVTSKSPLRYQLEDMIDSGDYPFNVDIVRASDVAKVMRDKYSAKSVSAVLSEIGCLYRECKRSTGKREMLRLYAVRGLVEWEQLSMLKWVDEYDARKD
ncbi:bifunctional DNA primase/polymerase [Methylomonas sp. MgM2]